MDGFVKMIGRPTGIPGPARGGEKKGCRLAASAWPGSGRPERGKQNGFPRSGNPFFPRSDANFVSPGKNGFICLEAGFHLPLFHIFIAMDGF